MINQGLLLGCFESPETDDTSGGRDHLRLELAPLLTLPLSPISLLARLASSFFPLIDPPADELTPTALIPVRTFDPSRALASNALGP